MLRLGFRVCYSRFAFIFWPISSNETLNELFTVVTFILCATLSAVNTAYIRLLGPAINGSWKLFLNVLSIVGTNESVALKEGNIREPKFQRCDSSLHMSGGNLLFILSEIYVDTLFLTRKCSKDQMHFHKENVVPQYLVKLKELLTFFLLSVQLNG